MNDAERNARVANERREIDGARDRAIAGFREVLTGLGLEIQVYPWPSGWKERGSLGLRMTREGPLADFIGVHESYQELRRQWGVTAFEVQAGHALPGDWRARVAAAAESERADATRYLPENLKGPQGRITGHVPAVAGGAWGPADLGDCVHINRDDPGA